MNVKTLTWMVSQLCISLADLIMLDAGCTAVDYAFLRRMTMSARIPNSFELIVRSFLQNAVFAGPFEAKLSRCALCWPVLDPVCIADACSTMFSINAVVQCLTSLMFKHASPLWEFAMRAPCLYCQAAGTCDAVALTLLCLCLRLDMLKL